MAGGTHTVIFQDQRIPVPAQREPEDPLAWLPCSEEVSFHRGEHIFDRMNPPSNLYLVIEGKVKVSFLAADGTAVLLDVYQPDDIFGESAFIGRPRSPQTAIAMEDVRVMKWSVDEIESLVAGRPRLALALMHLLVRRSLDFTERIESFCADAIPQRLARALLRFADRFSQPEAQTGLQMLPLTHGLLAQYVGTSREIVTQYMNRFRRDGLLQYSRASIIVDCEATRAWLEGNSASPERTGRRTQAAFA